MPLGTAIERGSIRLVPLCAQASGYPLPNPSPLLRSVNQEVVCHGRSPQILGARLPFGQVGDEPARHSLVPRRAMTLERVLAWMGYLSWLIQSPPVTPFALGQIRDPAR